MLLNFGQPCIFLICLRRASMDMTDYFTIVVGGEMERAGHMACS